MTSQRGRNCTLCSPRRSWLRLNMWWNSQSDKTRHLGMAGLISRKASVPVVFFSHLRLKSAWSSLVWSLAESLDSSPWEHLVNVLARSVRITQRAGAGATSGTELWVVWFERTPLGIRVNVEGETVSPWAAGLIRPRSDSRNTRHLLLRKHCSVRWCSA